MSNTETAPVPEVCGAGSAGGPTLERMPGRVVPLSARRPLEDDGAGGSRARDETLVTRVLPSKHRRMVGAWCFVDHYGPDDIGDTDGMQVAPHPHSGLATVSWLYEGRVHHRDAIGSDQVIAPGGLGLMSAGRAVSHSERSPDDRPRRLHGMQLWLALPDSARHGDPTWTYADDLPVTEAGDARVTVLLGTVGGVTSPVPTATPLVGAQLDLAAGGRGTVPLEVAYEHALVLASGSLVVDGERIEPGELVYLGDGRTSLDVTTDDGAVGLLLGGEPFAEELVMWWNFIGRDHDEVAAMRERWNASGGSETGGSGEVGAYGRVADPVGDRIPAPPLPNLRLRPRGRTR